MNSLALRFDSCPRWGKNTRWAVVGLISLILLSHAPAALLAAAPIPTRPIHTSKNRFRIPFRYDPAELQKLAATQIMLYVSDDGGIKWRRSQTVAPEVGGFTFNAPTEGEYWFAVRTLSADGSVTPEGNTVEPGLIVIVDATPPDLHLALRQVRPGWVQLTWHVVDHHLDLTKMRLQYQQPDSPQWKPLSIVPAVEGQTQWSVPDGGNVSVRGTVSDLARNIGEASMQTTIAAAGEIVPSPNVPDFRKPVASSRPGSRANVPATLPDEFPNENSTTFAPVAPQNPSRDIFPPNNSGPSGNLVSTPTTLEQRWKGNTPENSEPQERLDVPYRVVNSHEFSIGYKIDDVGPSGVSAVEVYLSENTGKSWRKYGNDGDRKSPARVKVASEGTYGVAMRVRSGVGLATEPPASGEKPDIMVIVDTTPPHLRLLPLQQGEGVANNKILIGWEAVDKNLGEKPISLYYASTSAGPWHPITGAHANTGRYLWTVGQGVPSKLYIRVKAQDTAGNAQEAATTYPVLVDLAHPRARIVDVEPESTNPR